MVDTVKRTGGKSPMVAQLLTLALLILPSLAAWALGVLGVSGILQSVLVVVAIFALVACWPFVGPGIPTDPDRGIAALLGLISLALVFILPGFTGLEGIWSSGGDPGSAWPLARLWLESTGLLLTILAVVMFVRQMARKNRRMVIRGISATALSGLAVVCASGWVLLPSLCSLVAGSMEAAPLAVVLVVVVGLILLVGLVLAGREWGRDLAVADAEEVEKTGQTNRVGPAWFGMALVPVMLSGALVVLSITALHFLV